MKLVKYKGGFVAPPPSVCAVVQVGFFEVWLEHPLLADGKTFSKQVQLHYTDVWLGLWLFPECDLIGFKRFKSPDDFVRKATERFDKHVAAYLKEKKA